MIKLGGTKYWIKERRYRMQQVFALKAGGYSPRLTAELKRVKEWDWSSTWPSEDIVPIETVALTFLGKMLPEEVAIFGDNEEETLKNYIEYLQSVAGSAGVLPLLVVADVTNINKSILYKATTEPLRDNYFPKALTNEPVGKTKPTIKINIFHKDFVNWVGQKYNPHRDAPVYCGLNKYLDKDQDGLPIPTYFEKLKLTIDPCTNLAYRRSGKFCNSLRDGYRHHVLAGWLDTNELGENRFQKAGRDGSTRVYRKRRSVQKLKKKAKVKVKAKPKARSKKKPPVKYMFVPESWVS